MKKLPEKFLAKMQNLLKSDYPNFLKSYDCERYYGLRVNELKLDVNQFKAINPFNIQPIQWTNDGFYYDKNDSPGLHPYYYAGLYYIQEPSAMAPGTIIGVNPGEKVLDLCAAPGGKTIQIAAALKDQGILVANDISAKRIKALVKNIELFGVKNAVITNETPERLEKRFSSYFDKILVDAPCSGEGMMRKDKQVAKSWGKYKVEQCAEIQKQILKSVDRMLKPNGVLCYSTCTFSPEENEGAIEWILKNYPYYEVMDIEKVDGMDDGQPEWIGEREELKKCARFWPHKVKGEGHFVALLKKVCPAEQRINKSKYIVKKVNNKEMQLWNDFINNNLTGQLNGLVQLYGNNLYIVPNDLPDMEELNVIKTGLRVGSVAKGRFEPSHALVMALTKKDFKNVLDLSSNSDEVKRYLKGETLMIKGEKGYVGVCVDGYPLGWAKYSNNILKNKYPKAWRKMK